MKRNANVLEFFQNFYAGFLQVLLQIYIFMGHWNGRSLETKPRKCEIDLRKDDKHFDQEEVTRETFLINCSFPLKTLWTHYR